MSTSRRRTVAATALMLGLLGIGISVPSRPVWASHTTFARGDVFVAVGHGKVQWRHPDGSLNKMLATGTGGRETTTRGMAFDAAGDLYVTNFDMRSVSKFDTRGNLFGTFGSGYDRGPESIVFDRTGNAYVGQADGTKHILKFDARGTLLKAFNVPTEHRGSDWIELAADQHTMFYTSEGRTIKRYDVTTNAPLPDFAAGLPGTKAFALRLLPSGGGLVADSETILRFDDSGTIVQPYDAPGQDTWFALNLDPDRTSFWSADYTTGNVYKFEIATGKVLLSFHAQPEYKVLGLAVHGEPLQPPRVTPVGFLKVMAQGEQLPAAARRNLEIILDASGSMKLPLGTSTRIGTARQMLRDVLAKIPDDFNVGLRLYAHRYRSRQKETCTDTELVAPIQKLDRQRLLTIVERVQPKGETPLIYSSLQAPADLQAVGGGSVIVITDGEETCGGDPVKAAEVLKNAGIPIVLHIVGFALKGKQVERQLTAFAEATGGHYYSAQDGEALARALTMAALSRFPYVVYDVKGTQVAQGVAGQRAAALPPGPYKVVVHAGQQELQETVVVTGGTDVVVQVARRGERFELVRE